MTEVLLIGEDSCESKEGELDPEYSILLGERSPMFVGDGQVSVLTPKSVASGVKAA
jgi:hypothetical protein